jgi:hypothetical protein
MPQCSRSGTWVEKLHWTFPVYHSSAPTSVTERANPTGVIRFPTSAATLASERRETLRQVDVLLNRLRSGAIESQRSIFLFDLNHRKTRVRPLHERLEPKTLCPSGQAVEIIVLMRRKNRHGHLGQRIGWRLLYHDPTIRIVCCA